MPSMTEFITKYEDYLNSYIFLNEEKNDKIDKESKSEDHLYWAQFNFTKKQEQSRIMPSKQVLPAKRGNVKDLLWLELCSAPNNFRQKAFYLCWQSKKAIALNLDSKKAGLFFTSFFTNCSFAIYAQEEFRDNPIVVHSAGDLTSEERVNEEKKAIQEAIKKLRSDTSNSPKFDNTPGSRMSSSFSNVKAEDKPRTDGDAFDALGKIRLYGARYSGTNTAMRPVQPGQESSAFICGLHDKGEWRFFMQVLDGNCAVGSRTAKDVDRMEFRVLDIRDNIPYEEIKYK